MRWLALLALLAGCASSSSDSFFLNGHVVDIEAHSTPVGFLNQYMAVVSSVDKGKPEVAIMPATSGGQATVNTLTTAGAVAGIAIPVYEGLKAQGANIP
jgi:hypothetical protein